MAQKMNNASVADEINNSAADALFIISYIKVKVRFPVIKSYIKNRLLLIHASISFPSRKQV